MDNQGWISLHRKIRDNPIYTNRKYLHIWIEILLSVNHKEKKFIWNNETITIEKGQGIFSQKKLSEELGIPIGTVHRCLKWLKMESMVETKTTSKFTLIKVLNWDMYQENGKENGKQNENRMKAGGKQNETNNNDNNVNNDNKYKSLKSFKANKDKIVAKVKLKYTDKNCDKAYDDFVEYCDMKKTDYKDHFIAYMKWVREDRFQKYYQQTYQKVVEQPRVKCKCGASKVNIAGTNKCPTCDL